VALSVGRLEPRKGIDGALEAVAALAGEAPDLIYLVVGEGSQRPALEARARRADLAGRVRFVGHVSDDELPAFYRLAEVFLLPGRREEPDEVEGFGIALCEAAASGLPVIGGASGGIPEAMEAGRTGLLVDGRDPRSIAAALLALLADRELAERLGCAGREAVLRYLNWDRAASEAWAIVREAGGRPRAAASRKAAS
jgi:phosphatidylinositol alpha-1,6-mannosyltransferase